ncbi:hypothetical protein BDW02DRAFT_602956 [Decorospora gaudefroyi]|uniref:DUF7079 domain-containing protein n=1 Tax=Decorospora gaudefroyi TaxID=184978 RepID=A0A6A5JXJ8_9PLEO|nr:hypothetical protein BDW02DRAFT_602956 [Decorospora gaudefroyi]
MEQSQMQSKGAPPPGSQILTLRRPLTTVLPRLLAKLFHFSATTTTTMPAQQPLTAPERTACYLLSEIFLDTEVEDVFRQSIARKLYDLPLTLKEIDTLFWFDVYPALIWNLVEPAGAWVDFGEEYVCNRDRCKTKRK